MNVLSEKVALLLRGALIVTLVALSAVLRMLPHPWNLTPIGATALFSGAMFRNRWIALLLPLASLFAGDIFVGFHKLTLAVYASFAISVGIGRWLTENRRVARIGGAVVVGALQFYAVTNFAMWAVGGFYPKTAAGLTGCMVAGLPYLWNTLAGDALYACILFGGFALADKMLPALRLESAPGTKHAN